MDNFENINDIDILDLFDPNDIPADVHQLHHEIAALEKQIIELKMQYEFDLMRHRSMSILLTEKRIANAQMIAAAENAQVLYDTVSANGKMTAELIHLLKYVVIPEVMSKVNELNRIKLSQQQKQKEEWQQEYDNLPETQELLRIRKENDKLDVKIAELEASNKLLEQQLEAVKLTNESEKQQEIVMASASATVEVTNETLATAPMITPLNQVGSKSHFIRINISEKTKIQQLESTDHIDSPKRNVKFAEPIALASTPENQTVKSRTKKVKQTKQILAPTQRSASISAPRSSSVSQHQMGTSQHQMGPSQHQMGPTQHQMRPSQHQMGTSQHQMGSSQHQMWPTQHQMGPSQHQIGSSEHQMGPSEHQMGPSEHQMVTSRHQIPTTQQYSPESPSDQFLQEFDDGSIYENVGSFASSPQSNTDLDLGSFGNADATQPNEVRFSPLQHPDTGEMMNTDDSLYATSNQDDGSINENSIY